MSHEPAVTGNGNLNHVTGNTAAPSPLSPMAPPCVYYIPRHGNKPNIQPDAFYLFEDPLDSAQPIIPPHTARNSLRRWGIKVWNAIKRLYRRLFSPTNYPKKPQWQLLYADETSQTWEVNLAEVKLLKTILALPLMELKNRIEIAKQVIQQYHRYTGKAQSIQTHRPTLLGMTIFGDSLSDEGLVDGNQHGMISKKIFYLFSIRHFYKFYHSPFDTFTNGISYSFYVQNTAFIKNTALKLPALPVNLVKRDAIQTTRAKRKAIRVALTKPTKHFNAHLRQCTAKIALTNKTATNISANKKDNIINYAQGGATSFNYSSFYSFFRYWKAILTRLAISHLSAEAEQYITHGVQPEYLHSIWIGANDLITIGYDTKEGVDRAIASIGKTIECLVQQGARYYLLGTLPHIGSTPRYRNKACEFYYTKKIPSEAELKTGKKYQYAYIFQQKEDTKIILTKIEKGIIKRFIDLTGQNLRIFNDKIKAKLDIAKHCDTQPLKDLLSYEVIDQAYKIVSSIKEFSPSKACKRAYQKQKAIDSIVDYFNQKLREMSANLKQAYQKKYFPLHLEIFDYAKAFSDILKGPDNNFNDSCTPYLDIIDTTQCSWTSNGNVYYDDIHPTADMHAQLGEKLSAFLMKHYRTEQQHMPAAHWHFYKKWLHDDTCLPDPEAWEKRSKRYGHGCYEI